MLKLFAAAGIAAVVALAPAPNHEIRGEELMAALKKGGYTVVLRHARTDHSFQERRDSVPVERYDQRNLNDDGVKDARLMGVVFKKYGIPFGEIISSPMFRTKETAEYAAGKPSTTMALRVLPPTPEQAALVKGSPKAGTNRLLVTHHFVIEAHVPGIKPGEIGESEAVVIKTLEDGTVHLAGRITLADWSALAGEAGKTAGATAGSAAVTHGGGGGSFLTPGYVSGAAIPNTQAGHLASSYITAFSSGDTAKMRDFIETYLEADVNRPVAARLASFAQLYAQHGSLTVTGVDNTKPEELVVFAHAKAGALRLTIKPSTTQHMRAQSITIAFAQGGTP